MKPHSLPRILIAGLLVLLLAVGAQAEKPRLLVLTDIGGDPDDQQSLIRLLCYANHFDFEGFIATGSKGDATYAHLIHEIIDAYAAVRPKLAVHADGLPEAEALRGLVKTGSAARGRDAFGEGKDTEGARWIQRVLEKEDTRPLDISIWGGQTDFAQALWNLRRERSPERMRQILAGLRVHDIADQDSIADWITGEFPELFYVLNAAPKGVDKRESVFRGMYLGGDEDLSSRAWVDTHVRKDHGPLGALYPDRTWTVPNPHGVLKEGDTPSWFYFLRNGLMFPEHPAWGGWGGRFQHSAERLYIDAADTVGETTDARATVWRWRKAFQADFQARMDWCVAAEYADANHNPKAVLNSDDTLALMRISAKSGDHVRLSAEGSSDPDGNGLAYRWFAYPEAGTLKAPLEIAGADTATAVVAVPASAQADTAHVILEVRDDGTPPLSAFRRAVLEIAP